MFITFWLISKPWPAESVTEKKDSPKENSNIERPFWKAPDESTILSDEQGELIRYGKELISHTASYLGPNGKVAHMSNGMNCQNCHLKAGTVPFGNNYSGVAANYPKFRDRSGTIESVEKRVNDCIERSLNGKKLDSTSREMRAFVSYITWVGKDVPKKTNPNGVGLFDLKKLQRPAAPVKGKLVYEEACVRCHQANGEGLREENSVEWKYPPL